jgi:hypothetical protein
MSKPWEYSDNKKQIFLPDGEPKQKLKLTGSRFANILGINTWQSAFTSWCEVVKVAKIPFEGNMYTEAGKAIEPKVIDYLKKKVSKNILSPEEYFGNRYESVKYDFYPEIKIFGGMWDAVRTKADMKTVKTIIEIKTTKRAEDWVDGCPVYYLAQACEYAYLETIKTGVPVEDIIITVSFLDDDDYNHPEKYVVTEKNTKIFYYQLSQVRFTLPDGEAYSFNELIEYAKEWWKWHVVGAISPEFDEKKDAEILKILRTNRPENDNSLDDIIGNIAQKEAALAALYKEYGIEALEKEVKNLKDALKAGMVEMIGNAKKVEYGGWSLTKGDSKVEADVKKLVADGMNQYLTEKEGTLTLRKMKEE